MIEEDKTTEKGGMFTHSYYQGLIVEIGNIKGFKTYVPSQDKNKIFLNKPLKEMANLDNILKFTYEDIVQKVRSIDVFWFNEREFPAHIFEIEHTTDFKNSLLKFLELQDFNIQMCIVAHKLRREEFKSKINFSGFKPIKERIRFITYEDVAIWHAKSCALMLTESKIWEGKIR